MSISKQSLQDFAKLVHDHPAFEQVIRNVQEGLFMKSLGASREERDILSNTMDAMNLFVGEINLLFDSIDEDKAINDDPDEELENA